MGRMFDFHVLDMIELGIEKYIPIDPKYAHSINATPSFVFFGEEFETNENFTKLRNLFLDFFKADVFEYKNLQSLEHVISLTAKDGKILFRVYKISLKNSGSKVPKVELTLSGPSIDFVLRRTKFASRDLMHAANKQPKGVVLKKQKNITHGELGRKKGLIHMPRQDLSEIVTSRQKALNPKKRKKIEMVEQAREEKKSKKQKVVSEFS